MSAAMSKPAVEANWAAPSSVWKAQPSGRPTPIRAAGTRWEMLPKSVAKGNGGGSGSKPRPGGGEGAATAAVTRGVGPDAGNEAAGAPDGAGQRGAHGERGALDSGLVVGEEQQRAGEHEAGALLDVAVQDEALDHQPGARDVGGGAQERVDGLDRRLGDVVAQ